MGPENTQTKYLDTDKTYAPKKETEHTTQCSKPGKNRLMEKEASLVNLET